MDKFLKRLEQWRVAVRTEAEKLGPEIYLPIVKEATADATARVSYRSSYQELRDSWAKIWEAYQACTRGVVISITQPENDVLAWNKEMLKPDTQPTIIKGLRPLRDNHPANLLPICNPNPGLRSFFEERLPNRLKICNPNYEILSVSQDVDIIQALSEKQAEHYRRDPNRQLVFERHYDQTKDGVLFDHKPSPSPNLSRAEMYFHGGQHTGKYVQIIDGKRIELNVGEMMIKGEKGWEKKEVPVYPLFQHLKPEYHEDALDALQEEAKLHMSGEDRAVQDVLIEKRLAERLLSCFERDPMKAINKYNALLKDEELAEFLKQEVEIPTGHREPIIPPGQLDILLQESHPETVPILWEEQVASILSPEGDEEFIDLDGFDEESYFPQHKEVFSTPKYIAWPIGDTNSNFMDYKPYDFQGKGYPYSKLIENILFLISQPHEVFMEPRETDGKPTGWCAGMRAVLNENLDGEGFGGLKDNLLQLLTLAHDDVLIEADVIEALENIDLEWRFHPARGPDTDAMAQLTPVKWLVNEMERIEDFVQDGEDVTNPVFPIKIGDGEILVDAVGKIGNELFRALESPVFIEEVRELYNKGMSLVAPPSIPLEGRIRYHAKMVRFALTGIPSLVKKDGKVIQTERIGGIYNFFRAQFAPKVMVPIIERGALRMVNLNKASPSELLRLPFIHHMKDLVPFYNPVRAEVRHEFWQETCPGLIYTVDQMYHREPPVTDDSSHVLPYPKVVRDIMVKKDWTRYGLWKKFNKNLLLQTWFAAEPNELIRLCLSILKTKSLPEGERQAALKSIGRGIPTRDLANSDKKVAWALLRAEQG